MPIVSVVIPAYNAGDYIEQALESVCSQTLKDIEVIVVDDGSTDDTARLVAKVAEDDCRVTLIKQCNQYAGVARNNGMDKAHGEYLYFLDADDFIEQGALECLLDSIKEFDADIAVGRSEGIDSQSGDRWIIEGALNGVPLNCFVPQDAYASSLFSSFIGWPWDKLFRKEFVDKTGLRFQALRTTNDALFVFGALALASGVVGVDKVLFHHRTNNIKSLEGTRSKSWSNAIAAMGSIRELLLSSERTRDCLPSYNNWVLNYSCWTIDTLPEKEADDYLDAIAPMIANLPESGYVGVAEQNLRRLAGASRIEAIRSSISYCRELSKCREDNQRLKMELEKQRLETERLGESLSVANRAIEDSKIDIQAIYDSHSYRIGNTLLRPLSAIKRGISRSQLRGDI